MTKTVGILGGMGPMSTVDLMRMITEKTPVKEERDHLRLLVDSRPQIPDRPAALLAGGPSPVPMLQESARLLQGWGAELLAIPCNTAHAFLDAVREAVTVEVLDMIGLVGRELKTIVSEGAPVGLLATTAAGRARVFHDRLPGFRLVLPPDDVQEGKVTSAILRVKLDGPVAEAAARLREAVEAMDPAPAAVIAGCTEIELALSRVQTPWPVVQPMDLLAEEIVERAWRIPRARNEWTRSEEAGRDGTGEGSWLGRADA